MRWVVMAAVLAGVAAVPVGAQERDTTMQSEQNVLVTGIRIREYRDRLRACLARGCPPNEDADATLALAEALMLRGEYRDARIAVAGSLDRNRRHRRAFPEPVADLYRADARLSRHIGYPDRALRSTHEILNTLQAGIPGEDHRHLTARYELAELLMLMGRGRQADRVLDNQIEAARAAGREDVATLARLRRLWYRHIDDPRSGARQQLERLAALSDPARRMETVGAKMLLQRIYRADGDARRADALLAEVGRLGGHSGARRLLYAPRYSLMEQEVTGDGETTEIEEAVRASNVLNRLPRNLEGMWIDVGFWVMPDGKVSGVEIVRRGAAPGWADSLVQSIGRREYSTADEATYRLERYSLTADYEMATGTRLLQRSPRARVEYLDLTGVQDPPPVPGGGGGEGSGR